MEQWTHMPFLCRDNSGTRILLFSAANQEEIAVWKLYAKIGDQEPIRLNTGFAADVIECSPTAWHDETGWHVSFISNGASNSDCYRLYRMDGVSLDTLSKPVAIRIARSGFIYEDRIAVGEIQDVIHVHDPAGDRKIALPGAFIYRVAYRADSPEKLLISGDWIGESADVFTLEYNLETDEQRYLECDGFPAYKCTIFENEILYAKRESGGFEDRHIESARKLHRVACQIAERHDDAIGASGLTVSKRCGCRLSLSERKEKPVRPSCLECVEKHLGAAAVLLSEIYAGYAYRLYFIGHLIEAEEESQDWPELHNAVRSARKNYQKTGTIPDWETLAEIIENNRETS